MLSKVNVLFKSTIPGVLISATLEENTVCVIASFEDKEYIVPEFYAVFYVIYELEIVELA